MAKQLNLKLPRQNSSLSDPTGKGFNYTEEFKTALRTAQQLAGQRQPRQIKKLNSNTPLYDEEHDKALLLGDTAPAPFRNGGLWRH